MTNEENNNNTVVDVNDDLAQKIIRQIEYYFSDANLTKDKFMQEELKKESGWVPIDTLTRFNRLKALSSDASAIISSLRKSESGLLEIDEENKKLRRNVPMPDNFELETTLKQNTIYVKGLPLDLNLDSLYTFFEKSGKVLQIFMRKFPTTKKFKGSAFVTFENNEQVQSVLENKEFKYNETLLTVEKQEDYLKRKEGELERIKKEREDKQHKRENADEEMLKQMRPGCVIRIKGLNEEATREALREVFDNYTKIEWIHYERGQPEALLRLANENSAREALETALKENNGKLVIKNAELDCDVLEGDEEKQFWLNHLKETEIRLRDRKNKKRKMGGGASKRGGKGAYNRNKNDRKRNASGGDEGGDEPSSPNKKLKVETEADA